MKIKLYVETKWVGAKEELEIDTWEDLGMSDEEWDNLPDFEKDNMLREVAMGAVGFGFYVED